MAAKVITAANVFAHIPEPHKIDALSFLTTMACSLMSPLFAAHSGTLQCDTVYHEHLRYYHLGAMMRLLGPHGLEVFRVKRIPTRRFYSRLFRSQGALPVDQA